MTLRLEQKAERRTRILAAAREIIAEHGYPELTMRDLARKARLTVPTIYNLIGSKEAVLFAAVEEQTAGFVAAIQASRHTTPASRILSVVEACVGELLRLPRYYQTLLRLLLTSEVARETRGFVTLALTHEFERAIEGMRSAGELCDWADPRALASRLGDHMNMTSLEWAADELDARGLRAVSLYGASLILLGVTEGRGQQELRECAARTQAGTLFPARREPRSASRPGS